MRRPIVAGNWKMHGTGAEAKALTSGLLKRLQADPGPEVVLCPPFTALAAVGQLIAGSRVELGAQNVHWEAKGAYTGEVAPGMLRDLGCRYVLVGHSERRIYFGETDDGVNRRARAVLGSGMRPVMCVGETLEQREQGRTEDVVRTQVEGGLQGLSESLEEIVIAYEPVWAIGTGKTATPDQAQSAHAFIRGLLVTVAGPRVAGDVRILYGGSVKPSNAAELFALDDVDGGLVGGAALDAEGFARIVQAA